jgi:signal transduction histidine kinase/DNA-binding NarL/FixJ family response regulator
MKTILVLAPHPEVADAVKAAVDADQVRVIHRFDAEEAEALLNPALIDVCIVDADHGQLPGIWTVEKVIRRLPGRPVLVYASGRDWEWEEESYVRGVRHVLIKPVRPRVLNALLAQLWAISPTPSGSAVPAAVPLPLAASAEAPEAASTSPVALSTLRDLSKILSHSLCAEALLRQFLLALREILGVNRSAIFLRRPASAFPNLSQGEEARLLHSTCAIGLPQGLLSAFKLSFESGIGGYLFRHGRILRRESREAQGDPAMQKEFEILGVQVAVPVPDRETLVGVAVFDGHVTGQPLSNTELELVFHLLEALGLAVKNIWLHDQLAANNETMAGVLRQLSSGCVVVSRDLRILHANQSARRYFAPKGRRHRDFEFADLPAALGSKVYQVLKTGAGIAPFKYRPTENPEAVYQTSIVPVQNQVGDLPGAALLIVEDYTQHEQLHRLELEAAGLRLVRQMADRLAHEVGNAMVPLSTHQQLFAQRIDDPEFRASLELALSEGLRRVTRLINQMRFLARDQLVAREQVTLAALIEEAYQEAQNYQPVKSAQLRYNIGQQPIVVEGDRLSLKHAIAEIMLNSLQANPSGARIDVEMQLDTDRNGREWVHLEFRDNGGGFTPEAARRASEPFFTTRNVGLGLGLVVSRKVAETHSGRIEILAPQPEWSGVVRFSLPLSQSPSGGA